MRRIAIIVSAAAALAASGAGLAAATQARENVAQAQQGRALADGPIPCVVVQVYLDPNNPSEIDVCPPVE